MSRRGRSKDVAISLFSFQDIITSVTAIMILLVLILTLELVAREAMKGMAAEDRQTAQRLKRAVADMEARLSHLRAEAAAAHTAATDAAGFSPELTAARQRQAKADAEGLEEEIERLEVQLRDTQSSRRSAEGELADASSNDPVTTAYRAAEMNARAAEIEATNQAEKNRQQKLMDDANDGSATARTLVFNAPPGTSLSPLLVEVSEEGLTAVTTAGDTPRHFAWSLFGEPAGFDDWLSTRDSAKEYVVLILRPSGIDHFGAVRESVVSSGFEVGTELIGEHMGLVVGAE